MPDLHDAVLSQVDRYLRSNAPASEKLYAVLQRCTGPGWRRAVRPRLTDFL